MNMKKKFILEFDKAPTLLFVSDGRNDALYEKGVLVENWRYATIRSGIDEITTYETDKIVVPNKDSEVL